MSKRSRAQMEASGSSFEAALLAPDIYEAVAERYNYGDTLILPATQKKKPQKTAAEKARQALLAKAPPPTRAERRLSKSQQRKMAKLQEEREKKLRRSVLMESLQKSELKPEEMALLFKSGALGHKLSAKEQVTRAFKGEKLGVALPEAANGVSASASLYVEKEESESDRDSASSDVREGSEDDDGESSSANITNDAAESKSGKRVRWQVEDSDDDENDAQDDNDVSDADSEDADAQRSDTGQAGAGPAAKRVRWDDSTSEEEESDEEAEVGDKAKQTISSSTSVAKRPASSFAFSVKLPGKPAAGASSVPPTAAGSHARTREEGEAVNEVVEKPIVVPGLTSGRHKIDHSMKKLEELRQRNISKATSTAESNGAEGIQSQPFHRFAVDEDEDGGVPHGAKTAADLVLLREQMDLLRDSAAHIAATDASSLLSKESDPNVLRAALWSADGRFRLQTDTKLPESAFSAYKLAPMSVRRDRRLQDVRSQLPVFAMENEIMDVLSLNDVVILCGETGSGKTTQVPQFLFEAGYGVREAVPLPADAPSLRNYAYQGVPGVIAVTQPRRVAAVATAQRVAQEMGYNLSNSACCVGYQVRYDASTIGPQTRIKFMTDGILLRDIQEDLLLRKYSVIVLDEAHERNLNTDMLIGFLSRAVPLRNHIAAEEAKQYKDGKLDRQPLPPIKLIIMSATLRVSDFTENAALFPTSPPVIRVEARQFPVTIHFAKRTELEDYVTEAFSKVMKIHSRLPDGGILVFLTGQDEIESLVNKLKDRNNKRLQKAEKADEDDKAGDGEGESTKQTDGPMHILPLYSLLPKQAQMKVFEPPPEGHRLIVVATNVAETSITIPNIRYVVDAGRVKRKVYDLASGTSEFQIGWISQAAADQRAGRAGRTGPGHCYRLYSSAVFGDKFDKFESPEITTMPIENVVLTMKAAGIDSIVRFPFPSPPPPEALATAVRRLINIGTLVPTLRDGARYKGSATALADLVSERLTPLGFELATLPLAPSLGKMLVLGVQQEQLLRKTTDDSLLQYVIAVVAAMTVQTPMVRPPSGPHQTKKVANVEGTSEAVKTGDDSDASDDDELSVVEDEEDMDPELMKEFGEGSASTATATADPFAAARNAAAAAHAAFRHPLSDALTLLRVVGAHSYELERGGTSAAAAFCKRHFLRAKSMNEMQKLRKQLAYYADLITSRLSKTSERTLEDVEDAAADDVKAAKQTVRLTIKPPSVEVETLLRQILTSAFIDQVARRAPPDVLEKLSQEGLLRKGWVPYLATATGNQEILYVHPLSAVHDSDTSMMPPAVVFTEIVIGKRPYMRGCSVVDAEWLANAAAGTPLISFGTPLETPAPRYDERTDAVVAYYPATFGVTAWKLPPCPRTVIGDTPAETTICVKYFAKALLEGVVMTGLKPFASLLIMPVTTLAKTVLHQRAVLLLDALQHPPTRKDGLCPITTARALAKVLKSYPAYLSVEVKAWLPVEHHPTFEKAWPAIVLHFLKSSK